MIPLPIFTRNPKCQLCDLHKEVRTVCMPGRGSSKPRIILLGESPGEEEDKQGVPFVGRAGQLLDSIISNSPLKKYETYFTNPIKCHPAFNSKPNVESFSICSSTYLVPELRNTMPELIICLGKLSGATLLQSRVGSVADWRKNVFYTKPPMPNGIPFIVTYHPAAIFHQDNLLKDVVEDFRWADELLTKGMGIKKPKKNYKVIHSIKTIEKLFYKYKWVTIDLETDGLDPFRKNKKILSVQISFREASGYYIDWNEQVANNLIAILESSKIKINNHALKHDLKWLKQKTGYSHWGTVNDTIINIHLIDENFPSKSLDTVVGTFTELKGHKTALNTAINNYIKIHKEHKEPITKARRRLWGRAYQVLPLKTRVNYGVGDVDASGRLKNFFRPKLKEKGLIELNKLMSECVLMYTDIECNGIHVDVAEVKEQKRVLGPKLNKETIKMERLAGEEINLNSYQQLGSLIYGRWKCKDHPVKSGKKIVHWTTAKDALELILLDDIKPNVKSFITSLLDYRKNSKLYGTYLVGMKRFIRDGDLIHANWNLTGTETGRTSVNDPGLQTIPRKGEIKGIFNSRWGKDGRMLQADVSQGELRIIAHVAEESNLIRLFNSGTPDIHRTVGSELLGIPESKVSDDQRYNAKQVNFAVAYGSGPRTVANEMKGVTIEEALQLIKSWHKQFPGWRRYCEHTKRFVIDNHHVRNIFGRYRHILVIDPDTNEGASKLRSAINSPIQGGLSDFNKYVGTRIWRRIRGNKKILMVAEVHDAYWFDCHESQVYKAMSIIKEEYHNANVIKEFGIKFKVPMLVDMKFGNNLRDMKEFKNA